MNGTCLLVKTVQGHLFEVRGAKSFTIEDEALYVWNKGVEEGMSSEADGDLLRVFAPKNWVSAEWSR